uniref:Uncharacterized protein n=1 Tax=Fusarium oxysporum (strain Fo5176) TaxID=660025 RepID=A0A0D2Y298_FUSOF
MGLKDVVSPVTARAMKSNWLPGRPYIELERPLGDGSSTDGNSTQDSVTTPDDDHKTQQRKYGVALNVGGKGMRAKLDLNDDSKKELS